MSMPKRLKLQIQPELAPGLDVESAVARLRGLSRSTVTCGDENGPYINVDYAPVDIEMLWRQVRKELRANPKLSECAIVFCEGDDGWDDYLLLHHFDASEPLDEVT